MAVPNAIDWNMVSAIALSISAVIFCITAIFSMIQLFEMKRSGKATAFIGFYQLLQEEETRQSRRILFEARNKLLEDWNNGEIKAAEKVCSTCSMLQE